MFYEDWIGLSSGLHPRQRSIGYMGDGFYRSKDPTNLEMSLRTKQYQSTLGTNST